MSIGNYMAYSIFEVIALAEDRRVSWDAFIKRQDFGIFFLPLIDW